MWSSFRTADGVCCPYRNYNANTSSMLLTFSSRYLTDAVTGFVGSAKRALGSRIMGKRTAKTMEAFQKIMLSKSSIIEDI